MIKRIAVLQKGSHTGREIALSFLTLELFAKWPFFSHLPEQVQLEVIVRHAVWELSLKCRWEGAGVGLNDMY